MKPSIGRHAWRVVALLALSGACLQLYFAARIGAMAVIDPQSTAFQRSEVSRLLREQGRILWSQSWLPARQINPSVKRAVIASEDAGFVDHNGVEWDALEKAWRKNSKAQQRLESQKQKAMERYQRAASRAQARGRPAPEMPSALNATPKVIGGSTITQQLAKNLFLSSERSFLRKGQEIVLTFMLEGLLSKERILEVYLNNVEWGEGVFGVEAASRHYFHISASQVSPVQAARLAVMLPAPKRFEKNPGSGYLRLRSNMIAARLRAVELP